MIYGSGLSVIAIAISTLSAVVQMRLAIALMLRVVGRCLQAGWQGAIAHPSSDWVSLGLNREGGDRPTVGV